MTTKPDSKYQLYLQGGLLNERYLKIKSLNEGSFGIVSIAKDTHNDMKLVAVKYNTGRLADFDSYEGESTTESDGHSNNGQKNVVQSNGHGQEVKSFSLNSKTKSNAYTSHSSHSSANSNSSRKEKDISRSIVLRETDHEVAMLKKVDKCPNITKLIDHFDTFMVLEYASRGDLHDAIQQGMAPVATPDVIDVFNQLINAVEYCHKNGVYHRDIKPENILITESWSIKLTDFGLATDQLICHDFDVGSERYMAPELLEHSDIDSYAADKVDIWSLGIVLLNIVFGKSPFRSACSKDRMFLHFAANRDTLFDIFPFMSYDLFTIMINSLTIDPANRDLEMIKMNLKCVDILTYDYEFEEEVDDGGDDVDDFTSNKVHNAHSILVEEPNEDDSIIEEEAKELTNHGNTEKPPNSSPMLSSPFTSNSISQKGSSIKQRTSSLPNQSRKSLTPVIHVTHDEQMASIDTLIDRNASDSDENGGTPEVPMSTSNSKPITIGNTNESANAFNSNAYHDKQYPVDHERVRKYSHAYNSINSHNNRQSLANAHFNKENYRVKRWTPAHRKPLKIANYNQRNRSQDGKYRLSRGSFKDDSFDFNRKDFFTPKSVLFNYMETAFKNKQNLQQNGNYYRFLKDGESTGYNNYRHRNNNMNYHVNYEDRRAWQKRKRRYTGNTNNSNTGSNGNNYGYNHMNQTSKNRGSFKYSNSAPRNGRPSGSNWYHNNNTYGERRRMSNHVPGSEKFHNSDRKSMDGKYIPPNLRFNASSLMGSAILSDDEFDADTEIENEKERSEEEDFPFEFEDGGHSSGKQEKIENDESNGANNSFYDIQSNAINLLAKHISDTKIFEDRGNVSRDPSLTTTISNNVSSTGSNITNSPKTYKKYVPPHQRRSSHSGAEPPSNFIFSNGKAQHVPYVGNNLNSNSRKICLHDALNEVAGDKYMAQVSMSAPTKSTSFFNAFAKASSAFRDINSKDDRA